MWSRVFWFVLVTAAIVFGLYFAIRAGFRWLRRAMEARQRRRLFANAYQFPEVEQPSYVVPIWVAGVQVLFLLALFHTSLDAQTRARASGLMMLASVVTIAFAFVVHGLPQHRRTIKYVALWMGTFLLQVGFLVVDKEKEISPWVLAFLPLMLVAGTAIAHALRRRSVSATEPLAFTIHRLCMALGPAPGWRAFVTFLAMRNAGLFPGYLMLRYFVRPHIAHKPFLYLRSFDDDGASSFLGSVLAPTAGARGVVVGLVHEQQTSECLHRQTDHAWHAEVFALPNTAWQRWVTTKLEACAGVVIDMSHATPGVMWELEQALATLPKERICVASRTTIPQAVRDAGVEAFTYSIASRPAKQQARTQLQRWVDHAMREAVYKVAAPMPASQSSMFPLAAFAGIALVTTMAIVIAFVDVQFLLRSFAADSRRDLGVAMRWYGGWLTLEQSVQAVAACLVLASAAVFPLALGARRVANVWFIVPCALYAFLGAMQMSQGKGGDPFVELLKASSMFMALGYIIVSCIDAHATHALEVRLDGLVLALLAPVAVRILAMLLLPISMLVAHSPNAAVLGAVAVAIADAVAGYAFIVFIQRAVAARARGFPHHRV